LKEPRNYSNLNSGVIIILLSNSLQTYVSLLTLIMYFIKGILTVLTALTPILTIITSAQNFQIYNTICLNFGCWIQIQDTFCGYSDIFPFNRETCEFIDSQVSAGTNGGHFGPLSTCKGYLDVWFFDNGNLSLVYGQSDSLCNNGYNIFSINIGSGSCNNV
jgi:hypothetical protein